MAAKRRFYKSELTVSCESNARTRNYLGVAVSVLVLMLISSMIVAAIVIINPDIVNLGARAQAPREAFTLEEGIFDDLSADSFDFQWLASLGPGGEIRDELLFADESKSLTLWTMPPGGGRWPNNNTSGSGDLNQTTANSSLGPYGHFRPEKVTTLVGNSSLLAAISYQGFKLSPSRRYLLIWTARRRRFRHSQTAKYFLYDLKQDLILMLSTKTLHGANGDAEAASGNLLRHNTYESLDAAAPYLSLAASEEDSQYTRFQLVEWSAPDGDPARESLLLVQNNDIYALSDIAPPAQGEPAGPAKVVTPVRLTFTGKEEEIFNGVPDWLYEEEILGATPAFQVSPQANTLAYMSFNDSQVETMPFSTYGSYEQILPKVQRIKYPKAGRVNPRVSVHLVENWSSSSSSQMEAARKQVHLRLPEDLARRQHYINRIRWLTNDALALIWLNRAQNESYVVVCARNSNWACEKNLHMRAEGGWLDLSDDLVPLDERHYLALMLKYEGPDVGHFKHIARVSLTQPDTYTFLTGGRKEVLSIGGLDSLNSLVYYSSTVENDEPGQRQLFAARLDPAPTSQLDWSASCITCDHYPSECLYNYAKLSPSTQYYVFECDGPGVPRTELRLTRPAPEPLPSPLPLELTSDPLAALPLLPALATGPGGATLIKNEHQSIVGGSVKGGLAGNELGTQPVASRKSKDSSLLLVIESNEALRDKLAHTKAMPVTLRLRVPIPNTNYSANVIMLLPPELNGATLGALPPASRGSAGRVAGRSPRGRRAALPVSGARPLHAHLTADTLSEYTSQLPAGQQYPMVVDVYAGPGSQKVDFRFNINYGHFLASNRRTIYTMIDGRGSANQGTKRLWEMYHKFGTVEIQDQIGVANYLKRNLSFVDPGRVAIWGWSYGGYAAAMALAQSNARALHDFKAQMSALQRANSSLANDAFGINHQQSGPLHRAPPAFAAQDSSAPSGFECAASVAPVTNWIYYDTAYTERFMSSPYLNELYDENQSGDHRGSLELDVLDDQRVNSSSLEEGNKWMPLRQLLAAGGGGGRPNSQPGALSDLMMMRSSYADRISSLDLNDRYRRASLLEHIGDIDRKRFLLIHGTADDNVHFQQSAMLMKKLISKNIMFETRVYPDQDHGIGNRADKLHLFSTLSNFFAECFDMAY